ncbi:unnamed protein product [Discula destructiva]
MVLLTSSQVSVAISSAIVVSFTTALFLSGYVIQQRTVRNLRAAIRPENSPQLILPDRFRDSTTELEDGTIVMLDEYNRPVRLKAGRVSIQRPDEDVNVADAAGSLHIINNNNNNNNNNIIINDGLGDQQVVEITVQKTPPENLDQQQQKVLALQTEDDVSHDDPPQPKPGPVQAQTQPQPAPWEIRSEEDAVEETEAGSPEVDGSKPMSRAERRRKIKEEIQKLSQGETPLYYQRRLW